MRKEAVFLSFLLALGESGVLSSLLLENDESSGRDARTGEIPFQISLQYNANDTHFCSASLLTEFWVLAAAHCTVGKAPESFFCMAGTIWHRRPGQVRRPVKVINHEQYKERDNFRNDISLIKVKTRFGINPLVQTVKLPAPHEITAGGVTATLSGWCDNQNSGNPSETLQVVDITVIDQQGCKQNVEQSSARSIYPTNICADNPNRGHGICPGDGGGSLTVGQVLVGIPSWPIGDQRTFSSVEFPGVYTRVSEYIDWISPRLD